ncbi:hypothetical protein H6F86_24960 [Phormidium sp. FACHB-592]|uniref:Uncharacterized protein n=1 Tax=Stenomitos frigidus AS-A4 TaxID=2933935 RepID=A0ABV0KN67_9CYAN|nr:hypothetical protein [Phormidium sp. FACHB-592]MBD2077077.1 hypothetical protein [Phormidium sp. FACHB-592]
MPHPACQPFDLNTFLLQPPNFVAIAHGVRSVVKRVNGGVTTTVYASPGYNATMRSVYSASNYSYSSGRRTQTSSSSRY